MAVSLNTIQELDSAIHSYRVESQETKLEVLGCYRKCLVWYLYHFPKSTMI